jgi:hypothetical protein
MSRGKGRDVEQKNSGAMPTFVDVKLDPAQRKAFTEWVKLGGNRVVELQKFADDGYRVGVAWSGDHQTYTVSVTCRDVQSPNSGLCMTSFAGDLNQAIALAWYKHEIVCRFEWTAFKPTPGESFG